MKLCFVTLGDFPLARFFFRCSLHSRDTTAVRSVYAVHVRNVIVT